MGGATSCFCSCVDFFIATSELGGAAYGENDGCYLKHNKILPTRAKIKELKTIVHR